MYSDRDRDFDTARMLQLKLELRANSLFAYSNAYQSSIGACYYFRPSATAYLRPVPGHYISWSRCEQYLIVVRGIETEGLTLNTNPKCCIY